MEHFLARNGYDDAEANAVQVQEVYELAFSLKVLLDNIPNWKTRVGGHAVPVPAGVSVGELLNELCPRETRAEGRGETPKKRANQRANGDEAPHSTSRKKKKAKKRKSDLE